jgi:hypothetical protein
MHPLPTIASSDKPRVNSRHKMDFTRDITISVLLVGAFIWWLLKRSSRKK